MAILKHFRAKSPAIIAHDHEVICISDDDSSDSDSNDGDDGEDGDNSNDSDDSNDEGEFEDFEVDVVANVKYTEARFDEAADATHDETTVDGFSRDAQSDSGVPGGLPPKEEGGPETEDEGNATDIAPQDDAAGGDWDPNDDVDLGQDVGNASGFADVTCTSLRDIVVELDALRDRVAQLEAQQHVRSDCQALSPSKKRHRTTSASPRAKRRKDSIVNISATRAFAVGRHAGKMSVHLEARSWRILLGRRR
jgi:hypothetical protein